MTSQFTEDFVLLSTNFSAIESGWAQGNFNLDFRTDFADFVLLANNYGTDLSSGVSAQENVPEPASLLLLSLAVGLVAKRRRGIKFPIKPLTQIVFHPQNNTTRPNDWKIPIHHAMIVTRAAENTVWFASCNCVHRDHQNCRTQIVAPNGEIAAQCEMKQEALLVHDIDVEKATRAMFNFDLEGCADLLFADTVRPDEYAEVLPKRKRGDEQSPRNA